MGKQVIERCPHWLIVRWERSQLVRIWISGHGKLRLKWLCKSLFQRRLPNHVASQHLLYSTQKPHVCTQFGLHTYNRGGLTSACISLCNPAAESRSPTVRSSRGPPTMASKASETDDGRLWPCSRPSGLIAPPNGPLNSWCCVVTTHTHTRCAHNYADFKQYSINLIRLVEAS